MQSDVEVSNLNRRIRNMEDEMEQLATKLRTTNDKLEDIAKAADECERSIPVQDQLSEHSSSRIFRFVARIFKGDFCSVIFVLIHFLVLVSF